MQKEQDWNYINASKTPFLQSATPTKTLGLVWLSCGAVMRTWLPRANASAHSKGAGSELGVEGYLFVHICLCDWSKLNASLQNTCNQGQTFSQWKGIRFTLTDICVTTSNSVHHTLTIAKGVIVELTYN